MEGLALPKTESEPTKKVAVIGTMATDCAPDCSRWELCDHVHLTTIFFFHTSSHGQSSLDRSFVTTRVYDQ